VRNFGPLTGFRNPGIYPKKKNPVGRNPPKKPSKKNPAKTHPKFDPVSFLVLLITKDLIMFKAFNSTTSEFAK